MNFYKSIRRHEEKVRAHPVMRKEKNMTLGLKTIIIVAGVILAIVGIVLDNWKLVAIGDTVALVGVLFV